MISFFLKKEFEMRACQSMMLGNGPTVLKARAWLDVHIQPLPATIAVRYT